MQSLIITKARLISGLNYAWVCCGFPRPSFQEIEFNSQSLEAPDVYGPKYPSVSKMPAAAVKLLIDFPGYEYLHSEDFPSEQGAHVEHLSFYWN
jgi:hypothetical protein